MKLEFEAEKTILAEPPKFPLYPNSKAEYERKQLVCLCWLSSNIETLRPYLDIRPLGIYKELYLRQLLS